MKIEQLRIGNYVNSPTFGARPITVINKASGIILTNVDGGITESYEPIPLTEEILKQVGTLDPYADGGKYYDIDINGHNMDITIDPSNKNDTQIVALIGNDSIVIPACRYIHQLQNLYFILSGGHEIIIKL